MAKKKAGEAQPSRRKTVRTKETSTASGSSKSGVPEERIAKTREREPTLPSFTDLGWWLKSLHSQPLAGPQLRLTWTGLETTMVLGADYYADRFDDFVAFRKEFRAINQILITWADQRGYIDPSPICWFDKHAGRFSLSPVHLTHPLVSLAPERKKPTEREERLLEKIFAAESVMERIVVAAGLETVEPSDLERDVGLSDAAYDMLKCIRERGGQTNEDIAKTTGYTPDYVRRLCGPSGILGRTWVTNTPGTGYSYSPNLNYWIGKR